MTYMATPQHKNPWSRGHKSYNFLKSFLGHHYCKLSLFEPCSGVDKKIFKKYINFTLFVPKLPPLGEGGYEIYNFLSPFPTDATHQIWLKLAQ